MNHDDHDECSDNLVKDVKLLPCGELLVADSAGEAAKMENLIIIIIVIIIMIMAKLSMMIMMSMRTFSLAFLTRSLGETVSRQPPQRGPYNLSIIIIVFNTT